MIFYKPENIPKKKYTAKNIYDSRTTNVNKINFFSNIYYFGVPF